jgi:hypothetical protein
MKWWKKTSEELDVKHTEGTVKKKKKKTEMVMNVRRRRVLMTLTQVILWGNRLARTG